MARSIQFKNNSKAIKAQFAQNKLKALTAIGEEAVEITTDYMEQKYYHPIHMSGDLIRDVNFKLDPGESKVMIGNSLDYAPWVHNGTARMAARPYLKDAILDNGEVYKEIAAEHLGEGFEGS